MGVSSSLYSSISGLSSMGEAMSVLGDNIANVNTVSYKSSRTTFQDVLAQSVSTASGAAQVGRGVTLSTVSGLFAQGSFESSSSATDMAIGGQGFFMLRAASSSESDMYTRAGEFSFDQEGYIVNPVGNFVQGWMIDSTTGEQAGTIGDMRIAKTTPPVATLEVEVITNLDSREANETNEIRLFDSWNGTNAASVNPTDPIDSAQFEYTTAIKVYDSKGASHDITVYFDRTTEDNQWEYLVTCEPSEDRRVLSDREKLIYAPSERYDYESHKGAGALMYGVIDFDTSGNIKQMSAYNVPPDGKVDPALDDNRINLSTTDTYYSFDSNFTGATTNDSIKMNFGAQYSGVEDKTRQTLVSQLGAFDATGGYITAETLWSDVSDTNGLQLTGDGLPADGSVGATSDRIVIEGFDNAGNRVTASYNVDSNGKVQDLLDAIDAQFGSSSSIDAKGRLKITDLLEGPSGLNVVNFQVDGSIDDPLGTTTHDPANPFGENDTGINVGKSVIDITTSKRKITSQGQIMNSTNTNAITAATTPWTSVYDDTATGVAVADTDQFVFTGTTGDGTPVTATFDVVVTPTGTITGTVQDLLDFLETEFEADAEIDGAGRLVLTDRIADSTDRTSKLAIDTITATATNPWEDAGSRNDTTTTGFYTTEASTSGEDGSQQGAKVSLSFAPEALSTTQYANSSTTIFQDQNGFASGFLQSVSVDTDGIITGHYSNGQVLKKAQVALANFSNLAGLFKEGGNVYRETTDSGAPVTGTPGSNGLGSIAPNALEQSNVDLGAEFVKLITVQRGFQANSKIITTTDEMMNDLINMKR